MPDSPPAAAAKTAASDTVERVANQLIDLSHRVHEHPELAFQEKRASAWLSEELDAAGFEVEAGACGLPTAFHATAGSGDLHIGICAEYDALPGIGHACGHNIIASSAVGAGIALIGLADQLGVTVHVLGTPAEEGGGGKILMLERGGFAGIHAAMMVHPSSTDRLAPPTLAVSHLDLRYHGRATHASAHPERGLNAADALTVAQVAVGLLRQHILTTQRIHGIVTHGGEAPNIVPAETTAAYYVRAATLADLAMLEPRVRACFDAGAVATGCTVDVTPTSPPYSEFVHDQGLLALYSQAADALGRRIPPVSEQDAHEAGSTDMANVSLALPTIQPLIGLGGSTALHTPDFASLARSSMGDRAVLDGALMMAHTIVDAALTKTTRERLTGGTSPRR